MKIYYTKEVTSFINSNNIYFENCHNYLQNHLCENLKYYNIYFDNIWRSERNIYATIVTMRLDLLSLHYGNKSITMPENIIKYNMMLRVIPIIFMFS